MNLVNEVIKIWHNPLYSSAFLSEDGNNIATNFVPGSTQW